MTFVNHIVNMEVLKLTKFKNFYIVTVNVQLNEFYNFVHAARLDLEMNKFFPNVANKVYGTNLVLSKYRYATGGCAQLQDINA